MSHHRRNIPTPTYVSAHTASILREMTTCYICTRQSRTFHGKRPRPDLAYAVQCSTCCNVKFFNPVFTPATGTLVGYSIDPRLGACCNEVEWSTM